jgi:hypothetical protein
MTAGESNLLRGSELQLRHDASPTNGLQPLRTPGPGSAGILPAQNPSKTSLSGETSRPVRLISKKAGQGESSSPAAFDPTSASGASQISLARKGWVPAPTFLRSAVGATPSSSRQLLATGGSR